MIQLQVSVSLSQTMFFSNLIEFRLFNKFLAIPFAVVDVVSKFYEIGFR